MTRERDARHLEALEREATRIRRHCLEMTSEAGSGHPTSCLSAADLMTALFFDELRFEVRDPARANNDRFVLSKGHAAPLLYAAWAEAGAIPVESLKGLRRIDSDLEGHPTPRFPWADVATGSLGQGLSVGLGMALAAKQGRLDSRVFVLLGDGETAEGAVWEAVELAPHLGADNLVALVDVNRLGQSEATMLQHDVDAYAARFRAFGWHASVVDGHDLRAILDAFDEARGAGRPAALVARTLKGRGVSFLEDAEGRHGQALAEDELAKALAELPETPPPGLCMRAPEKEPPARAKAGDPLRAAPPEYERDDEEATRTAYGTALRKLGSVDPRVVALDGDVKNSTRAKKFAEKFPDRFVEGYIAEQNLVGMAMGLQARGKVPFVASFACFLTRAFDQIRMAGISRANLKLCGSHAGVSIGEDGPSQMGLEDLAMLRAIPEAVVLYPSDAVCAERLVALAAAHEGIVYLRTTRPRTRVIYSPEERFEIGGMKLLRSSEDDRIAIVAAGVTLHEALRAHDALLRAGIPTRVVDCYSVKPLPDRDLARAAEEAGGRVLTVEDHYAEGGLGEAVAGALAPAGLRVHRLAVRELPRSGPPDELLARSGIDADAIAETVRTLVA